MKFILTLLYLNVKTHYIKISNPSHKKGLFPVDIYLFYFFSGRYWEPSYLIMTLEGQQTGQVATTPLQGHFDLPA